MPFSIGVNGVSRNATSAWIGVGGVARRIERAWIGVNGVARQFYGTPYVPPPVFQITWDIVNTFSVRQSDLGVPDSSIAGEHIEFWLPYVAGFVPSEIFVNGTRIEPNGSNQGGNRFAFEMPAQHTTVTIDYQGHDEGEWHEVFGWNELADGQDYDDEGNEALYWWFQQPPLGDDVILRGNIRYMYAPQPPAEFVLHGFYDVWESSTGYRVSLHSRYGTLNFAGWSGNPDGWYLESLEWRPRN